MNKQFSTIGNLVLLMALALVLGDLLWGDTSRPSGLFNAITTTAPKDQPSKTLSVDYSVFSLPEKPSATPTSSPTKYSAPKPTSTSLLTGVIVGSDPADSVAFVRTGMDQHAVWVGDTLMGGVVTGIHTGNIVITSKEHQKVITLFEDDEDEVQQSSNMRGRGNEGSSRSSTSSRYSRSRSEGDSTRRGEGGTTGRNYGDGNRSNERGRYIRGR